VEEGGEFGFELISVVSVGIIVVGSACVGWLCWTVACHRESSSSTGLSSGNRNTTF